ncbi:MAG: glutamate--tRNA ligase [Cyclobacteriaceae bacterium]|nr:glutamate--tRNA ligase [Cyclobacteriaceae bacterium]
MKARVRFAPSPTGALHIGGVRTALYNFLLARQTGGTMILRIEDTDQNRYVPGAEEYILESLAWAGIQIDEGVGVGGPHAPYRQSERREIYQQFAKQLVESGHAYFAFDTEEELEAMRSQTPNAQYDGSTRRQMRNSLSLPAEETARLLESGSYVIRLLVEPGEEIILQDIIRGEVRVQSSQLDDKVLMKSDGMPTYHLANVIDDYLMRITHVIRGEEWLPSAPHHVLLYRYFGWEKEMPRFAHLPLLLKPDGNGKLSKRDADRMGFPIFPLNWRDPKSGDVSKGFRENGYLPAAVINFLALLGWNPGTTQELFSMEELIQAFSLDRVNKAGAKFDIHKAQWFNQHYLRALPNEQLAGFLLEETRKANVTCTEEKALQIVAVLRERVTFPQDFWHLGQLFFSPPSQFDPEAVSKRWTADSTRVLVAFQKAVSESKGLTAEEAKSLFEAAASSQGVKPGSALAALRIALTGGMSGPDLMQTMAILGGAETASRLHHALGVLSVKGS